MATWPEHLLAERLSFYSVCLDLPLAVAVAGTRLRNGKGRVIQQGEMAFRLHRFLHGPRFATALLIAVVLTRGKKPVWCILLRHVLLDYLTHNRTWRKVMWR